MRGLAKFLLFVACLAVLFYVRDAIIRSDIREKSMQFVLNTAGTVSAHWNRGELDRNADSNLAAQVGAMGNPHALDFAWFAQLGARTSELSCTLSDYTTYKDDTRDYIAASYACDAQYERGPATILITVMRNKENMPWKVGYFDVTSPLFQQLQPAEKK